jgi:hypothetical protein
MQVVAVYSFNNNQDIEKRHSKVVSEIYKVINIVDSADVKMWRNKTKAKTARVLHNPQALFNAFDKEFKTRGWVTKRVYCEWPITYQEGYERRLSNCAAYRKIDFVKEKVGIEVEFGKPILEVCSLCAKMTIFRNLGHIDCGIEIVPVKTFALEMSSGVSYFEQFVWDLENRGVADIDIPVLILGIDA